MLGTSFDLPPLKNRKPDDVTPKQGPIGRAVRKLTPRKSSFINLLKGKGWGAGKEEMKTAEDSTNHDLSVVKSRTLIEDTNQSDKGALSQKR
jgi:hypothetical protein